jgi:ribosomal protein S18 acetylase RimI-like enzyme
VDASNAGAIALYERHGFTRVREGDETVVMRAALDA